MQHEFGDWWTAEKLECLQRYLRAYRDIFDNNAGAKFYKTIYVDAFAGSGTVTIGKKKKDIGQSALLEFQEDQRRIIEGSTQIALGFEPGFDKYLFIERHRRRARSLSDLKEKFPFHRNKIDVRHANANDQLRNLCNETDWRRNRAVVFLDPYGMQVDWDTVEMLGRTKAIDLWFLFPLMGVQRMLTTDGKPPETWAHKITRAIGSGWETEFYSTTQSLFPESLFDEPQAEKHADTKKISDFLVNRLKTVFCGVAEEPRVIRTRSNTPLFLLCFACGDEKGCGPALRIARHILKMKVGA